MSGSVQAVNWAVAVRLIVFGVVLLGAAVATAFSVASARGPREHRFVVRSNLGAWGLLLVMLTLLYLLPAPWCYVVFLPYFVHVPVALYLMVRHQLGIRLEEHGERVEPG